MEESKPVLSVRKSTFHKPESRWAELRKNTTAEDWEMSEWRLWMIEFLFPLKRAYWRLKGRIKFRLAEGRWPTPTDEEGCP